MANTEGTGKPPVKKPETKPPIKKTDQGTTNQQKKPATKRPVYQSKYGVPRYDKPEEQQWGPYRVDQRAVNEAREAAKQWMKERRAAGERVTGFDARAAVLENLEPYLGDWITTGGPSFPGIVKEYPRSYDYPSKPAPEPEPRRGGGGGRYIPPPPVVDEMKVRSAPGIRRSPYWQSEDPYTQTFAPRFVVLGNSQAW